MTSRPGAGSEFWFTISAHADARPADVEDHDIVAAPQVAASPSPPAKEGSSGAILLAEDNPVNQRVATAMLEHLGFHVDVVTDGAQAVKASLQTPYEAVLMDCQMPILDGYEATGEIRRLQGVSARTPIIAVTASAMKSDQQRCLAAGMDDYLPKPLTLKALAAVMSRWAPDGSDSAKVDRPALDPKVVDRLARLGEPGEDFMGHLGTLFLTDASTRMVELREAVAADDVPTVRESAHTLGGASANLGATDLAGSFATMERNAAAGNLTGSVALLEAVEVEFERVRSALGSLTPTP